MQGEKHPHHLGPTRSTLRQMRLAEIRRELEQQEDQIYVCCEEEESAQLVGKQLEQQLSLHEASLPETEEDLQCQAIQAQESACCISRNRVRQLRSERTRCHEEALRTTQEIHERTSLLNHVNDGHLCSRALASAAHRQDRERLTMVRESTKSAIVFLRSELFLSERQRQNLACKDVDFTGQREYVAALWREELKSEKSTLHALIDTHGELIQRARCFHDDVINKHDYMSLTSRLVLEQAEREYETEAGENRQLSESLASRQLAQAEVLDRIEEGILEASSDLRSLSAAASIHVTQEALLQGQIQAAEAEAAEAAAWSFPWSAASPGTRKQCEFSSSRSCSTFWREPRQAQVRQRSPSSVDADEAAG